MACLWPSLNLLLHEGVFAESLQWSLEAVEPVYPGEETSVSIDSAVTFRDGNRQLIGSGLWKQGIFGSRNRDGSGERFNYKGQVLSRPQASTTLEADSNLEITDAITDFEIGTVGCNDFGFLCMEFTGGDNPNPDFFFRVAGATDNSREANTLVACQEQECLSSKYSKFQVFQIFLEICVHVWKMTKEEQM